MEKKYIQGERSRWERSGVGLFSKRSRGKDKYASQIVESAVKYQVLSQSLNHLKIWLEANMSLNFHHSGLVLDELNNQLYWRLRYRNI